MYEKFGQFIDGKWHQAEKKDVRNEKTAGPEKDEKLVWLAGRSPFWVHFNANPVMMSSSGPPKTSENSPIRKKNVRTRKTRGKDAEKERRRDKTPVMKNREKTEG